MTARDGDARPLLFRWRDAVVGPDGPPAVTRHVLLTLSLHMSQDGGSCWPSHATLASETGLSHPTIRAHLRAADAAGWIERTSHTGEGQGWRRHSYRAVTPRDVGNELSHVEVGNAGKQVSHVGADVGNELSHVAGKGGKPDRQKVGNQVSHSTSKSTPGGPARARAGPLPRDWTPNDTHRRLSRALGVSLDGEADIFRDHAQANGRTQKDWDAAFRNWLRKAPEFRRNRAGPHDHDPDRDPEAAARAARERERQETARRREQDDADAERRATVEAWTAEHPDEAARLRAQADASVEDDALGATRLRDIAYRRLALEEIERTGWAPHPATTLKGDT